MTRSSADITTAYDAWHSQLPADEGTDTAWHRLIKPFLADLTGYRVLEIGCGRGGLTAWLVGRHALSLVAADLSSAAVRRARTVAMRHTSFAVADIEHLPFPSASLDVVISCETVEHVQKPPSAITEMARVLRPGGRLFLTTPNYLSMTGLYRAYVRSTGRTYTEVGQPINQLTSIPRVAVWLRRAGLRITRIESVGHYLAWPGRQPIRIACLDSHWLPLNFLGLHSRFVAHKPEHSA
jgi:ubiquinone/menaquinone biosynthesis C-methylase UbiE